MENYIVIDTETTGISEQDEILQISIIDENGSTLLNEYCRPEHITEWPEAEKVHGISYKDVKNKPTLKELLPKISSIINSYDVIAGYNVEFDLNFVKRQNPNIDWTTKRTYDVMKAFAPIYGEFNEKYGTYKFKSLSVCAKYYGYEFHAHNSLEDCRATLHCLKSIQQYNNDRIMQKTKTETTLSR